MASELPLLLLISFDGFRHDFMSPTQTPHLWALAQDGAYFEKGVRSVFPTSTMPNHVSILTGLRSQYNGIVGNVFTDPDFGDTYDYWNFTGNESRRLDSKLERWYSGTPIWLANEKTSTAHRSGSMKFPAADISIGGHAATQRVSWLDFTGPEGWARDFDVLLSWFTRAEAPINLGLMYIGQPDHLEHQKGVGSKDVNEAIRQIDVFIGDMKRKLTAAGLWQRMNVILTADHGHINAYYPQNVFPFADYSYFYQQDGYQSGAEVSFMAPKGTTIDEARNEYEKLKADMIERDKQPLSLFFKPDIIKEFADKDHTDHDYLRDYVGSHRVGEILLVLNCNDSICFHLSKNTTAELPFIPPGPHGQHGFVPQAVPGMRAMLVFHGPAFRSGLASRSDVVSNIDLYPLMCSVLEAQCGPVNGSIHRIKEVLLLTAPSFVAVEWASGHARLLVLLFSVAVPLGAFALYAASLCCARRGSAPKPQGYSRLRQEAGGPVPNGHSRGKDSNLLSLEDVDEMSEDEL